MSQIKLDVSKSDPFVLEMGFNFVAPSVSGGSGSTRYSLLFTQSSLSVAGVLVVTHNLTDFPSSVKVQNAAGEMVIFDDWKDFSVGTGALYLQTATPIAGQWLLTLGG